MDPQLCGQLNFHKAGKDIQWKKSQSLQPVVLGKLDRHMQENKTVPLSYTKHKNKIKSFKDLSVRHEALENTGSKLFDMGVVDNLI